MLDKSRIKIYDYLYNLLYDVVTKNVYSMNPPQELTKSDAEDGFIVINVGDIHDASEFSCEAYGFARCYLTAYVPPITRGRLDYTKYETFENSINDVIENATSDSDGTYYIEDGSVLSMDNDETTNANNQFFIFVRSFVVNINKQE